MKGIIKGLTVDGNYCQLPELIRFCQSEVEKATLPRWKLDVFLFILDFLSSSGTIAQKTSGTTGTPKNIQLSKKSMLVSAKNTIGFFRLKKNDVAVLCLPVQYIAGKMMVVRAMLAGLDLKLVHPSGTPDFTGIGKIDFCAMVPMQATNLLNKKTWPNIKTLILGGAETGNELRNRSQDISTQVFETYGMAETCSHVALKKINGEVPDDNFSALPGVKLSTDQRGCLTVEADYLPEKITTNDCVEITAPNSFKWLGRFDNIINSGGIKIQPEVLEQEIMEILQTPCAIVGEPDELLGEKIVLAIEATEPQAPEVVIKKLSPHFDRKLLPKRVCFVSSLPRNRFYKLDRTLLKE